MADIKNLWPEELFKDNDLVLPITVLQDQAKYFNERTNNIVIASVDTKKVSIGTKESDAKPGILHTFKIIAPAIGNYDFELIRIVQENFLPYPLRAYAPSLEKSYEINNSEQLEFALKTVFGDKKIIAIIQSLIMQSKQ
jgi:hypothetical protein